MKAMSGIVMAKCRILLMNITSVNLFVDICTIIKNISGFISFKNFIDSILAFLFFFTIFFPVPFMPLL